jgi:predicted acylesterase/phospholipase RssA
MHGTNSALILAGAAAKGPFAAGALCCVAAHCRKFNITRVVGASSGALNGAVFAAGLRVGREAEAAELLEDLWRNKASAPRIASWHVRKRIVLSALEKFRALPTQRQVRLFIVATSLPGGVRSTGTARYTSYEETYAFEAADFTDEKRLELMSEVAVASSAIPVVFAPATVDNQRGPYWDGGLVNNAPLSLALKSDPDLEHIIVVSASPAVTHNLGPFHRFSLVHLLNIAIEERLSRDLYAARSFNSELDRLATIVDPNEVRRVLGWRNLSFTEIRPEKPLPGWLLRGFFSRTARREYIEQGREAARRVLRDVPVVRDKPSDESRAKKENLGSAPGLPLGPA